MKHGANRRSGRMWREASLRAEGRQRFNAAADRLHPGARTLTVAYSNHSCIESSLGRFASVRALAERAIRLAEYSAPSGLLSWWRATPWKRR
jgi:hypothetical protein